MKWKNVTNKIGHLLKETFKEFDDDNGLKLSAALSYYAFFSVVPLLIIIISLFGLFLGEEAMKGGIYEQIKGFVGSGAALQIQEAIKNVRPPNHSTFATTISVVFLLVGASGVFVEIQDSLNFIWGIKAKPKRGLILFIKNRLISFSMIGTIGFLFLIGLMISSLMDILSRDLAVNFSRDTIVLFYTLNLIFVFVIMTILFTLIFKILPDGKVALGDCVIGASFTAVLFMIGKIAISAYLKNSSVATVYGAAGSIILILVWIYYSAIILYFGAEFTKVYAYTHGEKIIPNQYSVQILKNQNINE